MSDYRIIEVRESILAGNDRAADALRAELKAKKTFLLNLMSSPGSGKTSTLLRTIRDMKDRFRIGIMEADIDSDVDAGKISGSGARVIQLHTGGMCHLDAGMTEKGLRELGIADLDLVSTVVPELLLDCWDWAVKRTEVLKEAKLEIETIPAVTYCEDCKSTYGTVEHGKICPKCGSGHTRSYLEKNNEEWAAAYVASAHFETISGLISARLLRHPIFALRFAPVASLLAPFRQLTTL